eukprot:4386884-Ditylum_brightwellii.AAC.1
MLEDTNNIDNESERHDQSPMSSAEYELENEEEEMVFEEEPQESYVPSDTDSWNKETTNQQSSCVPAPLLSTPSQPHLLTYT